MSDNDRPYKFMKGLDLAEVYYKEAVYPILEKHFPDLIYSAALIGWGSDVLGFDTEQSMDHGWGPRLFLFLNESDHEELSKQINRTLRDELPYEIHGFPTSITFHDDGTTDMVMIEEGQVNHQITITTVKEYFTGYFRFNPSSNLIVTDWLVVSQQRLRSIISGRIFHDGLGQLTPIVKRLQYYPKDVWLYLLANQWRRLGQEIAFMGRCGQVGDELGSRIVASRLIRDTMNLCFLMEKTYAPYIKWFGTAYAQLDSATVLTPLFHQVFDAKTWEERQKTLVKVYEFVTQMHNNLKITSPIEAKVSYFHNRPFLIIWADKFADAIHDKIQDEEVKKLPKYLGSVDQFSDSTDVLSYPNILVKLRNVYK